MKPWQINNANLALYTKLGLNILLFRVQIKYHMIHLILWHCQISNDFRAFHRFENSLESGILNHLQTKVTLKNPHSCIFFFSIYNPKEVRVLIKMMIKNPLMQTATITFRIFAHPLWISIFWSIKFFFF